jgi:acyl-CoA reductase-like NAD-dependent aldehyde dehydrogenase
MIPDFVSNWINNREVPARSGNRFAKVNPHNAVHVCEVARSSADDVADAVTAARLAQPAWAAIPGVRRGLMLHTLVRRLEDNADALALVVSVETGKSLKDAKAEVGAAIQLGMFYASEGQRLYGRTTTSAIANRHAMTVRQPIGVAGLIVAANTPAANVAWKVFPALICGNAVVLKSAEDTPATAWMFCKLAIESGLPAGVFNVIHGLGSEAGMPVVEHPDVGVVSFTGSSAVGKIVHQTAGARLARISLELGGKNPFVVCDDADLEHAVRWAILSAFSNAGQRCAAASRILIFESIYERFREMLIQKTRALRLGPSDEDDFGPVINERRLHEILREVSDAQKAGAALLTGGARVETPGLQNGFYLAPTLIEGADPAAAISRTELFGPVANLYPVKDFNHAVLLANDSPYGLTACIHTRDMHRAMLFCEKVQAGVAVVNAGTFGSEPHMPFGGQKQSGNGSREPGTEALNVYSEWKDIYLNVDPGAV